MAGQKGKQREKTLLEEILLFAAQVVVVFLVSVAANKLVFYTPHVSGPSMEPAYHDGDLLLCTRVRSASSIGRYDVVTAWQGERGTQIVKRVYGLPGETISADGDGTIYIDGRPVEDPYKKEAMENIGILCEPVVLGEGEFFVLGDNRNVSDDSRFRVGIVKFDSILGKVRFKIGSAW